jgi:hypothetical protein
MGLVKGIFSFPHRRERSTSLGGRLKSAFSVFSSSKYEGLGRTQLPPIVFDFAFLVEHLWFWTALAGLGGAGDDLLSNRDAPPSQSGDETKFHEVHYTKRDNNVQVTLSS